MTKRTDGYWVEEEGNFGDRRKRWVSAPRILACDHAPPPQGAEARPVADRERMAYKRISLRVMAEDRAEKSSGLSKTILEVLDYLDRIDPLDPPKTMHLLADSEMPWQPLEVIKRLQTTNARLVREVKRLSCDTLSTQGTDDTQVVIAGLNTLLHDAQDEIAWLTAPQGAEARPAAICPREVKRDSDFSVTVVFASCRLASEFERQMIANLKE